MNVSSNKIIANHSVMKRFLLVLIITFLGIAPTLIQAQTYSNNWVNFNNTYYKFKIANSGFYRITKSQLNQIGFATVPGNQFTIYKNGIEIPIFTSADGQLGVTDYIEFYGTGADGSVDRAMYGSANIMANDNIGLLGDSATYFLTYNGGVHPRIQVVSNNIPFPTPTPSAYCWASVTPIQSARSAYNPGPSFGYSSSYYYSSDYDTGEGFCYNTLSNNVTLNINTPNVYTGGPTANIIYRFSSHSMAINASSPVSKSRFSLNGSLLFDTTVYSRFFSFEKRVNISSNLLSASNNLNFLHPDNSNANYFNFFVSKAIINYPRTYTFNDSWSNNATFTVSASDRYLDISSMNIAGNTITLYDVTNNKMYIGSQSGANVRFYLDASASDRVMYISNSKSNVNGFVKMNFVNYGAEINQGDYIILSNNDYINASPSYINEYKNFRAGFNGGNHKVVVVDVQQLYDQFAYGIDFHPISIKNFATYALGQWNTKPEYLFIVGKGICALEYNTYLLNKQNYSFTPITTWGYPGSDNLLTDINNNQIPMIATGRLSAYNNTEVGNYLEKVKAYEAAVATPIVPTSTNDMWRKRVLHAVGAQDVNLQSQLLAVLNSNKTLIEDTLMGAQVFTLQKNTSDPVQQGENPTLDSLLNMGISYLTFYGHGSSQTFDYNLNNPNSYNAKPRFPILSAFACEVADIFRLTQQTTISERYIQSVNGGSIAMIAANNYGWTNVLPEYMRGLYRQHAFLGYGKTLGSKYRSNIEIMKNTYVSDKMRDIHYQSILFQGDPGLQDNHFLLPDYAVEANSISTIPSVVTTALDTFRLRVISYNLGAAHNDTVWIKLQHFRSNSNTAVFTDSLYITNLRRVDTVYFNIPLDAKLDIGVNTYTVKIDSKEQYEEVTEANNEFNYKLFIYSESLVPVYPKEFAIVNKPNVILKASTLNALAPLRNYLWEIDTTMLFNSSVKQSTQISSTGGVISWSPQISYQNNTVYYWRTAPDTIINGSYDWNASSFIYLPNSSEGWNQSHYFQLKRDEPYTGLTLNESTNRKFNFNKKNNTLIINNAVVVYPLNNYNDTKIAYNDEFVLGFECTHQGSLFFIVIDSASGKLWQNTPAGLYGSQPACWYDPRFKFEFSLNSEWSREQARLFIDSIVPNGNYIVIQNQIEYNFPGNYWNGVTASVMAQDAVTNNTPGVSLYHSIKNMGFNLIDQFDSIKVFGFFQKKGYPSTIRQAITDASTPNIRVECNVTSYLDSGFVSAIVGPTAQWDSLKWQARSVEYVNNNDTLLHPFDSVYVSVYGIDTLNQSHFLFATQNTDTIISGVNAKQYPNLNLIWYTKDTVTKTSAHLDYWRVLYKPVPEAAVNAAAYYALSSDSLYQHQKSNLKIAVENLTPYAMDSLLVKLKVTDASGQNHELASKRFKPLLGNDTIILDFDLDVSNYYGDNFLLLEVNPDNDQPEQYHPNNLFFKPFKSTADRNNPLLDVTFDGIKILDKDIVSAKPFVKILLRDENMYAALSDTSTLKVQLVYPNQTTPVDIVMDGTICKFIPANTTSGKKNEARIEFKPNLMEDGVYKLIVFGKDKSGNNAGTALKYEINFTVENKATITNVLNYPNPFSTSTQFLFTLTGSQIPSQFKIQILTITGKVVREIKKSELGNLHVGRNITDYRWDGKDEYGQLLGNGVYLYRVVTSIEGDSIEHRTNATVDKFFKNGYGKLYIMR
jgi:hypothetical protein